MIISRLKKFSEDGRNSRNASILKHGGTTAAFLGLGTTLGSDIAYDRMSIPVFQKSIGKQGSDPQKGLRIAERYLRSNKAAKRLKNLKKAGMGLAALGAASNIAGSYLKMKQDNEDEKGLEEKTFGKVKVTNRIAKKAWESNVGKRYTLDGRPMFERRAISKGRLMNSLYENPEFRPPFPFERPLMGKSVSRLNSSINRKGLESNSFERDNRVGRMKEIIVSSRKKR